MKKSIFVLFLALTSSSLFACPRYKVFDLGTLDTPQSEALQINDNLEVCGTMHQHDAIFFWSPESGLKNTGYTGPFKMNDLGQIAYVGTRPDSRQNCQYDIFIMEPKTGKVKCSLGMRYGNASVLKVHALNNLGQIVFGCHQCLCVWNNNEIKQIGNIFDMNYEVTINDKSELFGTMKSSYGYFIARCYQLETEVILDIKPSMKANYYGLDFNGLSQGLVRWKSMNGEGAFLWPVGLALSPNVRKINDKGQMLEGAVGLRDHDRLIDINKVLDLANDSSTPFERIEYINDINNFGQMVGRGIVNGRRHAVLILPIE